jgi:two-component system, sensor histidine kinase and response regulator
MRLFDSVQPTNASGRAKELFDQHWHVNARRTDRMFAALMILQWLAAVLVAFCLSPRAWQGGTSYVHPHLWAAVFLSPAIASLPIYLAWRFPGRALTRHVIAVAQVLFSSLLIHLSGGRIETHFHVFGSLAFLAFYRDWKVLVPATLIVAIDHFVRGVFWPQTVFGIAAPAPWRWLEHAGWVLYEDVFLIISCTYGVREMWSGAIRMAELERINGEVKQQTSELQAAYISKHAILETALDAVISVNDSGLITSWNSQAEAIFGWSAADALGCPVAETIIPAQHRPAHQEGMRRYLATGESHLLNQRIEISAIHRDGHEFPVELAIAPIRSGQTVSFCAFVRDITSRQQAEETLRSAKEAAEAANHAKSAFLANMSHEIRTPLNAILGFTDVLLGDIDGNVAERREHLRTIHDSGRHLLSVISDVLDLSKIESGQMQVEKVRCSPHEIIAATISILRVPAQERGLMLEYFWKSEIPDQIECDPARLRQILVNLIGNAVKFTEIGSVQVAARLGRGDVPHLIVDVIDTGVGVAPESIDRIFHPFVQADSSITRRFGGTGLGLSISRRLARLMGGDLTVNSEPGRGSIFTLKVATGRLEGVSYSRGSVADLVTTRHETQRLAAPDLPPCRILLVEDGVTNRKLISLVLERAGAKIRSAENGQAGVEAALNEPFDLILMDMQMPVMDGYAATRKLRDLGYTMPIIALTAHAMAGDERTCREAGCSGYLTKPVEPQKLLRTVADALSNPCDKTFVPGCLQTTPDPLISSLPLDDPEFREIVAEFVDRFAEKMSILRAAVENRDLSQIAGIAHWIRGAGGTAGFDCLTSPSGELEKLARSSDEAGIRLQLFELEVLLQRMQLSMDSQSGRIADTTCSQSLTPDSEPEHASLV